MDLQVIANKILLVNVKSLYPDSSYQGCPGVELEACRFSSKCTLVTFLSFQSNLVEITKNRVKDFYSVVSELLWLVLAALPTLQKSLLPAWIMLSIVQLSPIGSL